RVLLASARRRPRSCARADRSLTWTRWNCPEPSERRGGWVAVGRTASTELETALKPSLDCIKHAPHTPATQAVASMTLCSGRHALHGRRREVDASLSSAS